MLLEQVPVVSAPRDALTDLVEDAAFLPRPLRLPPFGCQLPGTLPDVVLLRDDFVHQDVPLILMANAGVVTATRHAAPDAWRRLVGYLIQSFAAEAARPLPDPPTASEMYRALTRLPRPTR